MRKSRITTLAALGVAAVLTLAGCASDGAGGTLEMAGKAPANGAGSGDKGTITIEPIESRGNMSGGVLKLFLEEARGGYKKGAQTVEMPPLKDRYEDQWREFAAVVNGEMLNPYTYAHDYLVHKCHLQACGMPIDV